MNQAKNFFKKNLCAFPTLWQAPNYIFDGDTPRPLIFRNFISLQKKTKVIAAFLVR